MGTRKIGRLLGCTTGTVSKWRVRYARDRLAGFDETGGRGAAPKYGPGDQKRILAMLDQPPPTGYSNWTAPLQARALGDVHEQYIWRSLRAQKIDLSGRKSWCESSDPEFVAKAAEIVGLYMAPPENAVVLSVDEKPSIQALERAQGYLKLPTGRAMIGQSHDDKRHGTTTLFAALNVASGKVVGRYYLVLDPERKVARGRILQGRRSTQGPHQRLHRRRQRTSKTVRLDKKQGSSKRLKPCFADQ